MFSSADLMGCELAPMVEILTANTSGRTTQNSIKLYIDLEMQLFWLG